MALIFELLNENCDRIDFDCGEEALNHYLQHLAWQDIRRELARTFIIRQAEENKILGYYTLCSGSIHVQEFADNHIRKLPKYPIPVARLARMAVDKRQQSKGYGELLLIDALYRASLAGESMGIYGMLIDAKHEKAQKFYQQYELQSLSLNPLLLFTSLKELRSQFLLQKEAS